MKTSKILAIIGVLVVVALAVMWFRNSSGGADVTTGAAIVTPMPMAGYSIQDTVTGASSNGFPEALPESLPPVPIEEEVDVITDAPETMMPETTSIPAMSPATTMMPTLPAVETATEGFMAFAPKNFRGDIL